MPDSYHTTDNENFAVHTGSAPSTIRHIIWQGLPGVYLAASDGGLLKTVDYGVHWDYLRPATLSTGIYTTEVSTWPVGAVGRQVAFAIGPKLCPAPVSEKLIVALSNDLIGKLYDPNSDTWSVISDSLDVVGFGNYPYNQDQIIIFRDADFDGLDISIDNGATYTHVYDPSSESDYFAVDNSGRIWVATLVSSPAEHLYSSNDLGINWDDVTSLPTDVWQDLKCHPTDPDKIATLYYSSAHTRTKVTTDGGMSWNDTLVSLHSNSLATGLIDYMSNGRLVVFAKPTLSGALEAYYSDDDGVTYAAITGLPSTGFPIASIAIGDSLVISLQDLSGNINQLYRGDGASFSMQTNPTANLSADGIGRITSTLYLLFNGGVGDAPFYKVENAETSWNPIALTSPGNPGSLSRTF